MEEWQERTRMLIGDFNLKKLAAIRVAVFGLGGVGGYAIEALARAGVGTIALIDNDKIVPTNLNRQILALSTTIGMNKTDAAEQRLLSINPSITIKKYPIFYSSETTSEIDLLEFDYIIDAIDTVTSKIELITRASSLKVPLISCMGTGNKLDPSALKIANLSETEVCPLARVMRKELKKHGITKLKVVYSNEPPKSPLTLNKSTTNTKRQTPSSISFVPSAAGLLLASEVIRHFID